MRRLLVLAAVPLLLANDGGCSRRPPPPQYTLVMPAPPAECLEGPISEPRLPDADITDDVAARDREALKRAFRASEAYRRICRAALETSSRRD